MKSKEKFSSKLGTFLLFAGPAGDLVYSGGYASDGLWNLSDLHKLGRIQ